MHAFLLVAALLVASTSAVSPGVSLAVSQSGINYVRAVFLPVLIKSVQNMKLPNPVVSGEHASIAYSVGDARIDGAVTASAELSLEAPSNLKGVISNLALTFKAHTTAKEKVWPHPHASCDVTASSSSSSVYESRQNAHILT